MFILDPISIEEAEEEQAAERLLSPKCKPAVSNRKSTALSSIASLSSLPSEWMSEDQNRISNVGDGETDNQLDDSKAQIRTLVSYAGGDHTRGAPYEKNIVVQVKASQTGKCWRTLENQRFFPRGEGVSWEWAATPRPLTARLSGRQKKKKKEAEKLISSEELQKRKGLCIRVLAGTRRRQVGDLFPIRGVDRNSTRWLSGMYHWFSPADENVSWEWSDGELLPDGSRTLRTLRFKDISDQATGLSYEKGMLIKVKLSSTGRCWKSDADERFLPSEEGIMWEWVNSSESKNHGKCDERTKWELKWNISREEIALRKKQSIRVLVESRGRQLGELFPVTGLGRDPLCWLSGSHRFYMEDHMTRWVWADVIC